MFRWLMKYKLCLCEFLLVSEAELKTLKLSEVVDSQFELPWVKLLINLNTRLHLRFRWLKSNIELS